MEAREVLARWLARRDGPPPWDELPQEIQSDYMRQAQDLLTEFREWRWLLVREPIKVNRDVPQEVD